jgi:DNA-binding MarR family transcriptional regulator
MAEQDLLLILRNTVVSQVRERADLTTRELAVLLITYLEDGPLTGSDLVARLRISRPAITRVLDRLEMFELVERLPDSDDRRRVQVGRTAEGAAYVADLRGLLMLAAIPA